MKLNVLLPFILHNSDFILCSAGAPCCFVLGNKREKPEAGNPASGEKEKVGIRWQAARIINRGQPADASL
jgi:hypothetical protein